MQSILNSLADDSDLVLQYVVFTGCRSLGGKSVSPLTGSAMVDRKLVSSAPSSAPDVLCFR